MSSSIDEIECPKCGRMALRDQDNRSGDVSIHCKCGWAGEEVENKIPAEYKKITTGFVSQNFELVNGKYICVSQEFIAGDQVDREDDMGDPVDLDDIDEEEVYQPFDMVQPEKTTKKMKKQKKA